MGLVGVRVKPGGEQRLGARRTETDQAVAALVQLYGLLDEKAPLAAALRAAAEGVDQQWLVAARGQVPELVQREHGEERADGEADNQPGRDRPGPAVPPVVPDHQQERDADAEREHTAVRLRQDQRPQQYGIAGEPHPPPARRVRGVDDEDGAVPEPRRVVRVAEGERQPVAFGGVQAFKRREMTEPGGNEDRRPDYAGPAPGHERVAHGPWPGQNVDRCRAPREQQDVDRHCDQCRGGQRRNQAGRRARSDEQGRGYDVRGA